MVSARVTLRDPLGENEGPWARMGGSLGENGGSLGENRAPHPLRPPDPKDPQHFRAGEKEQKKHREKQKEHRDKQKHIGTKQNKNKVCFRNVSRCGRQSGVKVGPQDIDGFAHEEGLRPEALGDGVDITRIAGQMEERPNT